MLIRVTGFNQAFGYCLEIIFFLTIASREESKMTLDPSSEVVLKLSKSKIYLKKTILPQSLITQPGFLD